MIRSHSLAFVIACTALVAACGGSANDAGDTGDKLSAAEAPAEPGSDICADRDYYGDAECDTFCPETDPDCTPAVGAPMVCAAFIEASDDVCGRAEDDFCRMQDPDCTVAGPSDPQSGVVCALYIEVSDGACSREDGDECRSQDPDCAEDPVACPELMALPNGVCDKEADDPCISEDPDCGEDPTVCALYVEASDGVCSREADDPCISQDPDCIPAVNSCAPQDARGTGDCEMVVGVFWNGASCTVQSGCSCSGEDCEAAHESLETCEATHDECIDEPSVCAAYIEEADGVCGRDASDPCRGQDPDCTATEPVACPEMLYPTNGECEAAAGCEYTDPDCVTTDPVVCLTIAYPEDGVCEAAPGCEGSDPDCSSVPADDCPFVVDGECFTDAESACLAGGCALGACVILESYPAQVACDR